MGGGQQVKHRKKTREDRENAPVVGWNFGPMTKKGRTFRATKTERQRDKRPASRANGSTGKPVTVLTLALEWSGHSCDGAQTPADINIPVHSL